MSSTPTEQTEAAGSGRSIAPPVAGGWSAILGRTLLLAGLTAIAFAALWYGFNQGDGQIVPTMPSRGGLLWLVVVFFLASTVSAGMARWAGDKPVPWARLVRLINAIPFVWYPLGTACLASFVIGQVANSQPAPDNYWPLFAFWLVAVGAVLASTVSGVRWSELRPAALKERLWPYRWELAAVAAVTVAAATLRLVILTSLPAPFEQDEAAFGAAAVSVLDGDTKNMFMSGLHGAPTMYFFAIASFYKVFGVGEFGIRLLSALAGTATIPVLYLLLRQMFDRRVGFLAALYLTGYHFHVHYSRVGLDNIGDVFIMVLTLYFAWRASRWGKTSDFILTGLTTGFSLYFWQAGKLAPLIVAALFGYTALRRPSFLKENASRMGLTLLAYGVSALPLGVFWLTHQNEFLTRMNEMGIFQSGWIDQEKAATGKSTLAILWDQAVHSFGVFGHFTDASQHYLAPIPLVDRLSLVPFLLGIAYALYRILEERYFVLLTLFAGNVIAGGVLTMDTPSSPRLLLTIPVVAAMVAIGLTLIADAASRWKPSAAYLVAGVGISALLIVNVHFYFWDYRTGGYYTDLNTYVAQQVVDYAKTLPEDTRLFWYGAPRMYLSGPGHPSMTFPLRDRPRLDVLEDGKVVSNPLVDLTGEAPATFMFMSHREAEMQPLIDSCPGGELKTFSIPPGRHGLDGVQTTAVPSFIAYQVLTPNTCLPVTVKPVTGKPAPAPTPRPTVPAVQATAPPGAENRNSQRIQDLAMLSQLLQQYSERANSYPSTAGNIQSLCVYEELDVGCKLKDLGVTLPADPLGNSPMNGYWYMSDGDTFTLIAAWEGPTQPPADFLCPATLTSVAEHSNLLCLQSKR